LSFLALTKKGSEKGREIKINAYMNSTLAAASIKAIRYIETIDHEGALFILSDVVKCMHRDGTQHIGKQCHVSCKQWLDVRI
jgi:hypothetical protein